MTKNILPNTSAEVQQQIQRFLQASSSNASLPQWLSTSQPHLAALLITYVLPQISNRSLSSNHNKRIVELIDQVLRDPSPHLERLVSLSTTEDCQVLAQMSKASRAHLLCKMINIHSVFLNLICQSINGDFNSIRFAYKPALFENILQRAKSSLLLQEQMIVINKLLLLGQEKIIVQHYISSNQLCNHFASLSKHKNMIRYLYLQSISERQDADIFRSQLTSIANKHQCLSSIMSLLSIPPPKRHCQQFCLIFSSTNKKHSIIKELMNWWSVSKHFILPDSMAKVRCNILAIMIQDLSPQQMTNGDYVFSISEGIRKRLTDGNGKAYALLIWKAMAQKLKLESTEQIKKAKFFDIEVISETQIVEENQGKANDYSTKVHKQEKQQIEIVNFKKKDIEKQAENIQKQEEKEEIGEDGTIIIQPKNIYDCILGLRSAYRFDIAIKTLPKIIVKHKQDLVLMWNSLLRQLLSPIKQAFQPCLILLFTLQPQPFVEAVQLFFMSRQSNISEKIWLMEVLRQAIQQLGKNMVGDQAEEDQNSGVFYFKKVKSRYIQEEKPEKEKQTANDKSRRWGHTRIAHQQKQKGLAVNLKIVSSSQVNRFHQIARQLYFELVDPLTIDLITTLQKHQILAQNLLRLLSTIVDHIRNHFQKYFILQEVGSICLKVVGELKRSKQKGQLCYQESGGQTMMLCLQVVNKLALAVDKYIPDRLMEILKLIVQQARQLPNYGMAPVLQMIEANIYRNVFTPHTFS